MEHKGSKPSEPWQILTVLEGLTPLLEHHLYLPIGQDQQAYTY